METYMTAREVAAMVRLSEQTIRRYVMNKEIPVYDCMNIPLSGIHNNVLGKGRSKKMPEKQ